MICNNYFCVYQENGICTLNEINIDIIGQCESCIYVDIPIYELKNYKKQTKMRLKNSSK